MGITNDNEVATKMQAFMITSLFSKNRDVVALFPVRTSTSLVLKDMTVKIIEILNNVGFKIVSLICDNHRMNRSMYFLLAEEFGRNEPSTTNIPRKTLSPFIIKPFKSDEKIFLLFDTVHLFKSIRNNWLNQANAEESLIFPHFDDFNLILRADLTDLKKIYSKECNNICRQAPALSKKVLYPSSLERQNV